ncbi:hypothetical protein [Sorangium sp. So ce693]|uniref:hypothetical protein n=2 Tax=unclassified Sorangium TaxID=2621164 RepID=UPI003F63BE08
MHTERHAIIQRTTTIPARLSESLDTEVSQDLTCLMDTIIAWAVGIMMTWAPPGKSFIKDAVETPEEGRARYHEIARAAAKVAYDPALKPLFGGPRGRAETMALLLSIAYFESGYRRDVDLGIGKLARGSGLDSCLLQVRVGAGKTREGWSHADLVGDREKCFRAGLALIKGSFGACRKQEPRDRLSAYTRGRCIDNDKHSRARIGRALNVPRAPMTDAAVLAAMPGRDPLPAAPPSAPPATGAAGTVAPVGTAGNDS